MGSRIAEEAPLVATTCSKPPEGRSRWALQLLADEMVLLTDHDSLSDETVRRRLAENELKPWQRRMWCGAWGVGRGAWGVGRGARGVGRGAWGVDRAP